MFADISPPLVFSAEYTSPTNPLPQVTSAGYSEVHPQF